MSGLPIAELSVSGTQPEEGLPQLLTVKPRPLSGVMQIAGGPALMAMAVIAYFAVGDLSAAGEGAQLVANVVLALFFVRGAWITVRAFPSFGHRLEFAIEGGEVKVREKRLIGGGNWTSPLAEFDGVRWRRSQRKEGRKENSRARSWIDVHVIELVHAQDDKTLPLEITVDQVDARRAWEAYARLLDLPAIDARDGSTDVREVHELDQTLRERAASGRVDSAWDNEPPPTGLAVRYPASDALDPVIEVTIMVPGLPIWFFYLLGVLGAFTMLIGLVKFELGLFFFGAVFAGAPVIIWRMNQRRPRRILISPTKLDLKDPLRSDRNITLPHDSIESLHVEQGGRGSLRVEQGGRGRWRSAELVISTDGGEQRVGAGLSAPALLWLKNLVQASIAQAPAR